MAFWDDIVKGAGDIANGTLKVVGDGINATAKVVGDGVNVTTKVVGDGVNATSKVVGDMQIVLQKKLVKHLMEQKRRLTKSQRIWQSRYWSKLLKYQ